MIHRLRGAAEYLRTRLWFIPLIGVLVAGAVAAGVNQLDRALDTSWIEPLVPAGPSAAVTALSVIAGSMLTFTALVFTITIVAVQQAGNQYSPRVIGTFLRDRQSKLTLAVFMGTFAFALITLRELGPTADGAAQIPALSVSVAFAAVLLSLGVFVTYLNHVAQSLRVGSIIRSVARETRDRLEDRYPLPEAEEPGGQAVERVADRLPGAARPVAWPRDSGVLQGIDEKRLVKLAVEHDVVIEIRPALGDFVPEGSAVARVLGHAPELEDDRIAAALDVGKERTLGQDVAFGFRQLVDIGERALSPGVNDPTTAVQVIDALHDLLRQLGTREFPPSELRDDDGMVRVLLNGTAWNDFVALACDEIRRYGAGSLQIARRLRAMLEDLLGAVPPDRHAPVRRQVELLEASVSRSFEPDERVLARDADAQGTGS